VTDAAGTPLRPAKLWNDTESAPDAGWLLGQLDGAAAAWARACGSVPVAAFTITKLSWLHRKEPDAFSRIARVMLPHDFLAWRVTGELGTDRGDASGTGYWSAATEDYRLDLLQIHNMAGVEEMLPVLREWKQAARIRYYGVTTSSARQHDALARLVQREPLDFIQVDYAIDNRAVEARLLPLAQDRGVGVLTNLPFGRGRVFQALRRRPIPEWAAALGIASWAQFALKYVVSHPAVTCAIPGTARLAYLNDNLRAARGPLPDEATRRRMAALIDAA